MTPDEAGNPAASPGRDRPPLSSPAEGRAVTGPGPNPQVAELARRLAEGERLSGPKVAAAVGCSERNARRLLAEPANFTRPAPSPPLSPTRSVAGGTSRAGRCT